jgi:hypothetical protein
MRPTAERFILKVTALSCEFAFYSEREGGDPWLAARAAAKVHAAKSYVTGTIAICVAVHSPGIASALLAASTCAPKTGGLPPLTSGGPRTLPARSRSSRGWTRLETAEMVAAGVVEWPPDWSACRKYGTGLGSRRDEASPAT